jgi:tetratricopeptide (TPR) repeat protein
MNDDILREQAQRIVLAFNAGHYSDARVLCEEALRHRPREPVLNHLFAAVLFADGDAATARTHIAASLAARAGNAPAQLLAGKIARAVKDFDAALSHFSHAKSLGHGVEVLIERARTLDAAAAREAAHEAWREVLQIDPRCTEAAARVGRLLAEDGMHAEAAAMLERAVAGDAPAAVWFDLGLARQDLRDFAGAAAAYRRALVLRPDFAEAAVNLGVALQDGGDVGAAMEAYRTAYRLREASFGMIATSLTSAPHGRLWLDREALKRSLRD